MNENQKTSKRWLQYIKTNWLNGLLIIFLLLMLFSAGAKAFVLQGLMKIGLFKPDITLHQEKFQPASEIMLTNTDGASIPLSSLKGKVVFLNFWATWCPPCIAEMPAINELHKKFSGNNNIVFVMVDADNNPEKSVAFLKTHQYNLPLYFLSSAVGKDMFNGTLPTTLVINKKGEIVFNETGAANYSTEKFSGFLEQLSKE